MAESVEIRVHGVSGTPPESLLEICDIRQVDGDDDARFFRERRLPQAEPVKCEAFHWGNMTSGSVSKALWLLMAPFGVINLAGYTLPALAKADGGRTRPVRAARKAALVSLRLLGLVLTVLLVATVAFVSIDLFAWQCGGTPSCLPKKMPAFGAGQSGWHWRLPLGAAFPAAVVGALTVFSAQVHLHPAPGTAAEPAPADATVHLGDARFWSPSPRTALLRLLHLSAALAVVTMLIAHLSTHGVAGLQPASGWSYTTLWLLFWVAAGIAAWCVLVTAFGRAFGAKDMDAAAEPNAVPARYRALRALNWLVFVSVVVIASAWGSHAGRRTVRHSTRLTGFDWAFQAAYAGTALLLAVLLLANLVMCLRRSAKRNLPKPFRWMWAGMAPSVLAGLAVLLATGFTSGLAIQLSRLLGHPDSVTDRKQPLELPDLFHTTALLWGLILVPVTLLGALCLAARYQWPRLGRLGMPLGERIRQDYPGEKLPGRTVGRIDVAWRRGRLKYRLPLCLAALGVAAVAAALVQGSFGGKAVLPGFDTGPGWLREDIYGEGGQRQFFTFAENTGAWALTGLAAGLAFLGMRAFKSPSLRRQVGILWDLLAFWPRLTHPIVPPPYGARAVLALAQRIRDKTRHHGRVVLSGHSQGSLICVAASLCVGEATRGRTALVTHGSQLMFAYARLFPEYVGHATLADLYTVKMGGRWRNLHRWSDPIGGPVLAYPATGPVDPVLPSTAAWTVIGTEGQAAPSSVHTAADGSWLRRIGPEYQLRDPHNVIAADGRPTSPMFGHSAYYADPAYDVAVAELLDLIGPHPAGRTRPGRIRRTVLRALRREGPLPPGVPED
ncbi:hypothetical protein ACFWCA_34265 [Streptomyces phaeochromogenes]|uniref:hypothetical protein n=1 Tax=Streptomyces phaeochromogenes TaxID=1923 RepID=UPI0036C8C844